MNNLKNNPYLPAEDGTQVPLTSLVWQLGGNLRPKRSSRKHKSQNHTVEYESNQQALKLHRERKASFEKGRSTDKQLTQITSNKTLASILNHKKRIREASKDSFTGRISI